MYRCEGMSLHANNTTNSGTTQQSSCWSEQPWSHEAQQVHIDGEEGDSTKAYGTASDTAILAHFNHQWLGSSSAVSAKRRLGIVQLPCEEFSLVRCCRAKAASRNAVCMCSVSTHMFLAVFPVIPTSQSISCRLLGCLFVKVGIGLQPPNSLWCWT